MSKPLTRETLGIGIAGTGFIGPVHVEALRRNGLRVLGLAEATPELCARKAADLGIPNAYASFEAMLADPAIHVVHLATPHHLHYSQAKAALLAGKHVLCEKPLAMNSSETGELVELAARTGLVNAINYNLRFYPLVHEARAMVQEGTLGGLFVVHGSYCQDWLLYPTDWNWRLDPAVGGALRAVSDIGTHWLDLIHFITGVRVREVYADFKIVHPIRKQPKKPVETYSRKVLPQEETIDHAMVTEDYAALLLHYENGMAGNVILSQVSAGRKNRLFYEIDGARAALSWDSTRPDELWIGQRDEPNKVLVREPQMLSQQARAISSYPGGHNEGFPDTFKQLQKKVYQYILAGDFQAAPDFPTFADGHAEIRLGEAAGVSAREKRWVTVD